MIASIQKKSFGRYNSPLKDYLIDQFNHDGTRVVYSNRYCEADFSITHPSTSYKNCRMINGYPHFTLPLERCLCEIDRFINGAVMYDRSYCIRFGDTHPDNIVPKFGQMRNVYIGDILHSLILTSGRSRLVYPIGDVSEKTITRYVDGDASLEGSVKEHLVQHIMAGSNEQDAILNRYKEWSKAKIESELKPFLDVIHVEPAILLESELYDDKETFEYIRNSISFQEGYKTNGNLKYCLQELMFMLNYRFRDEKIICVLGDNQSDHVSKVLRIVEDNDVGGDYSFLEYGGCLNSLEKDMSNWSEHIRSITESYSKAINDIDIEPLDFLRIVFCAGGNSEPIDFSSFANAKALIGKLDTIIESIRVAERRIAPRPSYSSASMDLIAKMALVFQELDIAVVYGEQSKFFNYIYDISTAFLLSKDCEDVSKIFSSFMRRALHVLSLDKLSFYSRL